MRLEATLVEPVVAKGAELPRQSPYSPDETELPRHRVNGKAETRFLPQFERRFGFALHVSEWICASETIRDESVVRIGGVLSGRRFPARSPSYGGVMERPLEYAAPRE